MAKATQDTYLIKQAQRIGLEKMIQDAEQLLQTELTEAQRVFTNEMHNQLKLHLEGVTA